MSKFICRLISALRCKHLGHVWRPAMTSLGAAKYCDRCEQTRQLSKAEFYAQFGTIPHIL